MTAGPRTPLAATEMVVRRDPVGPPAPVVVDSPHSGQIYPEDFRPAVPLEQLQKGEDRFVDELFGAAPEHGAILIAAQFARTYIDPNRNLDEIEPELLAEDWPGPVRQSKHTKFGVGLIFSKIGDGNDIYDRLLDVDEVRHRIESYWRPYHDTLEAAIDEAVTRDGAVFHLNVHSMLGVGDALSPDPGRKRPDFVLGDLDGQTCSPAVTDQVARMLQDLGYSVAINDPYKGAELVARYSDPAAGRHSLQIEMNRQLYMGEDLEPHEGFERLRADLGRMLEGFTEFAQRCGKSGFPLATS